MATTGLLIGGVRLDFAIRVDEAAIALRRLDAEAQADAVKAVRKAGDRWFGIVRRTVAYDTGRMFRLVRVRYTPKGYAFEGGWNVEDFENEGEPFYPPFVELGTSRMAAQPSIVPAYETVAVQLERDLAGVLRRNAARR